MGRRRIIGRKGKERKKHIMREGLKTKDARPPRDREMVRNTGLPGARTKWPMRHDGDGDTPATRDDSLSQIDTGDCDTGKIPLPPKQKKNAAAKSTGDWGNRGWTE
jgi:hypothetical protein